MKKIIFTFLCTLSLCFCDSPQQAFELLEHYSKPEISSLRAQYLKESFVLYRQDISEKISENVQMREKILNGKSEEQLFADSNAFMAGLDFLCLAMASNLARHYTFALESFGKNEFLDENSRLDKKSLIAALSIMVFMQNISSSHTQKTFSLYADLVLAQNKTYQALQIHKKALSNEEYSFYKNHIVPPPDSINENAYRTKSTSPFQSLAVVESEIKESLNHQKVEISQYSSHFFARIWRYITRDYEGNALSGTKRYFPVVTEIAFLLLYLMIFVLGLLNIVDSIPLNKEVNESKIENLSIQKMLSIKNILKFFMFGFALLVLYLVAILLTHSGLLTQRIIGYIGIISILVYLVGYGMDFLRKLKNVISIS